MQRQPASGWAAIATIGRALPRHPPAAFLEQPGLDAPSLIKTSQKPGQA